MNLFIDRLKSQLLTSGLQQKDMPLFQVISQLIDAVSQLAGVTSGLSSGSGGSGSGGGSSTPGTSLASPFPYGMTISIEGDVVESFLIPGSPGPPGQVGLSIPGMDGLDGLDGQDLIGYPTQIQVEPWIDIPYDAANYLGNGVMTWTPSGAQVLTSAYQLLGPPGNPHTLIYCTIIDGGAISGGNTRLLFAIFTALLALTGITYRSRYNVEAPGMYSIDAGANYSNLRTFIGPTDTQIIMRKQEPTNWPVVAAADSRVRLTMIIPVRVT